jgi:hypothetical protein
LEVTGAGFAAVALGLFEAAIQYYYGVRYGFRSLALVITVLIWKPAGALRTARSSQVATRFRRASKESVFALLLFVLMQLPSAGHNAALPSWRSHHVHVCGFPSRFSGTC